MVNLLKYGVDYLKLFLTADKDQRPCHGPLLGVINFVWEVFNGFPYLSLEQHAVSICLLLPSTKTKCNISTDFWITAENESQSEKCVNILTQFVLKDHLSDQHHFYDFQKH